MEIPQLRPISVELIFPCLDEAPALSGLFAKVPDEYRVILVDNGSGDGSTEIAAALGANVIPSRKRVTGQRFTPASALPPPTSSP